MSLERVQRDLAKVGKPPEVEGVLDLYLIRPGGFLVARSLRSTPVSPNALSVMALATGWLAAFLFMQTASKGNEPSWAVLAALALLVHSIFDSADGQLARWRQQSSELGRIIDGICDYLEERRSGSR